MPDLKVCKLCGSESKWCPDEQVWRHKDSLDGEQYVWNALLCDRQGYPIEVADGPIKNGRCQAYVDADGIVSFGSGEITHG